VTASAKHKAKGLLSSLGNHTLVANRVSIWVFYLQSAQGLSEDGDPEERKKATLASGPKFREETPKKGSNPATPIAVLHCKM
jgi:hypothetical protein